MLLWNGAILALAAGAPPEVPVPHVVDRFAPRITISASATDPQVSVSPSTGGTRELYLWLQQGQVDGYLDTILATSGNLSVRKVTGQAVPVFLTPFYGAYYFEFYGQSFTAPVVLAVIEVDDQGGSICPGPEIGPYTGGWTWPCLDDGNPSFVGHSTDGSVPCTGPANAWCAPYPSVDDEAWGSVKARYR